MKKINILIFSLVALFTSCNMEKYPYNSNEESLAIQSESDCRAYRNGIYVNYRGLFSGSYLIYPMLQGDEFQAVAGFSNSGGDVYMWDLHSNTGIFTSYWASHYSIISSTNFLIQECEKLLANTEISDEDKELISVYMGEAFFLRAFSYNEMAIRFCKDYEPDYASSELGLPLVTTYKPSANGADYPGRSTMEATYNRITDDIKKAEELITTNGKQNSPYVTKDVVAAFKARVALEMHDYQNAATIASSLLKSTTYKMDDVRNNGETSFANMWLKDAGTEVLWQIQCDQNQTASSTITYLLGIVEGALDYVPTSYIVDELYDNDHDMRFKVYFKKLNVKSAAGDGELYALNKYPGNTDYNPGGLRENLFNSPKVFRMAEMYLVAAEAYASINGGEAEANKYLNDLRALRIEGWVEQNYSGNALKDEIMKERLREMYGENTRVTDLKRWHIGVKRAPAQNSSMTYLPGNSNTEALDMDANDYRMVWAIPQNEMDVNPQLKGQQNPGY